MKRFKNGGLIVEEISDLPNLKGERLFLDLETTSRNPKLKSINPHRNCWTAGIAVCVDDSPAYYIPVSHNHPYGEFNLPREAVIKWMSELFNNCTTWINHNIKYDAHVAYNDLGLEFERDLVCTLTMAKLYDSERVYKGGYGLDVLSEQLLGHQINEYENRLKKYIHKNNVDYGSIHPYVLGEYACQDVLTNRDLYHYLNENLPWEVKRRVWFTEVGVTKALLHIERTGMRIEPVNVIEEQMNAQIRMLQIQESIYKSIGKWVNPSSPSDMFDVMCNIYGMPVIATTGDDEEDEGKEGNPSFAKGVLEEYKSYVNAPVEFIDLAIEFKKLKTYNGIFLETYKNENIDGILHPTYNQLVRTGRMSCSSPNMQQLSSRAKRLILPRFKGDHLLSRDYAQIEFRTIVHYMEDMNCIQAFRDNPDADFHTLVSTMMGVDRRPAKQLNFQSAYGGGKEKLITTLMSMPIIHQIAREELMKDPNIRDLPEWQFANILQHEIKMYATKCYNTYHRTFPNLKKTANECSRVCRRNGFVRTGTGRRRHIPKEFAYKAFNAVNQGFAADIIKEKLVELDQLLWGSPVKILGVIHDELLFSAPEDLAKDDRLVRDISHIMEEMTFGMCVPLRTSGGYSELNWADCGAAEKSHNISYEETQAGEKFRWMKL